jgi:intein/homing endonuclease
MFRDKLTSLALKRALSRIATPVIVEVHPGYLERVFEEVRQYEFRPMPGLMDRVLGEIEVAPFETRVMKRFNMFSMILPREVIFDLAEDARVARIYSDELKYALQYPTVPPEGIYVLEHRLRRKKVEFTSTYWTKRLMGADIANAKGFRGKGVKVAVLDTGASTIHEQLSGRIYKLMTVYAGAYIDTNGHGCIRGAYVYTNHCGVQRIEDLWELIDVEPLKTPDGGEFKPLPMLTLGQSGVVKVEGIYRCRAKKVKIHTPLGIIEATPWHKFMVIRPKVSETWKRRGWKVRRWYEGYEIEWKEAEKLEAPKSRGKTWCDYLLIKPYSGETWSFGIDPKIAYLAGYLCGDGTVLYKKVNIKTGKAHYARARYEIRAFDDSYEQLAEIEKLCRELGATSVRVEPSCNSNSYVLTAYGKKFVEKLIPFVTNPPINDLEAMRAWVAGFFDAEGYVSPERKRIRIVNVNKPLIEKLASFLTSIGIPSKVIYGGKSGGTVTWQVKIFDAKAFYEFVKLYVIKKRKELEAVVNAKREEHAKVIKRVGDYIALRIKKVEVTDEEDWFYDLAQSSDSTYLASGVVSHNTWCTACVGGRLTRADTVSRLIGRDVLCEGMAPECTLYAIKVLGFIIGTGSDSAVIKGIEWALEEGCNALSMSLGGPVNVKTQEEDPFYSVMRKTVEQGVIPVVAAGNEGPESSTISTPGWLEDVLTVGAYDPITGEIAIYSSRGPTVDGRIKPDVIAPGGGYPDHGIENGIVNLLDKCGDGLPDRYSPIQGTSMATPHVSGLVTLMYEAHKRLLGKPLTVQEVKTMMEQLGHPKTNDDGWGLISWQLYERWLETQYGVKF